MDLVYLDPPFNSNASYNVLFKEQSCEESPAQIKAFTDTREWTQEPGIWIFTSRSRKKGTSIRSILSRTILTN